ncbi:MAG: RNA polymerase sigma factor [Gemmataceae bacterium]
MNEHHEDPPRDGAEQRSGWTPPTEPDALDQERTMTLLRCLLETRMRSEEAEEAAQMAWKKFLDDRPVFTSESAADQCLAWLFAVALHEAANLHRQSERHPCLSLDALSEELKDNCGDGSAAAEKAALLDELGKVLKELRDRDPLNHRLLVGHHIEGRDIKELAKAEGLTVHAVWNRLNRLRAKLRKRLTRFRDETDFA